MCVVCMCKKREVAAVVRVGVVCVCVCKKREVAVAVVVRVGVVCVCVCKKREVAAVRAGELSPRSDRLVFRRDAVWRTLSGLSAAQRRTATANLTHLLSASEVTPPPPPPNRLSTSLS